MTTKQYSRSYMSMWVFNVSSAAQSAKTAAPVITYPLQHWSLMISDCRVVAGGGGESSCCRRRRRRIFMRELLHEGSAQSRLVRLDFATLVARLPINANLDVEKPEHS